MIHTSLVSTGPFSAELLRALCECEATRIHRVDPPQSAGTHPGQVIVARIPDLTDDINPFWAAAREEWQYVLGEARSAILIQQIDEHLDKFRDKLGRVPREFIRDKTLLIVQYREAWGKHQSPQTISLPLLAGSEFGHLFGPGAPCELR